MHVLLLYDNNTQHLNRRFVPPVHNNFAERSSSLQITFTPPTRHHLHALPVFGFFSSTIYTITRYHGAAASQL
jgi:hypothetical protein